MKWTRQSAGTANSWVHKVYVFHVLTDDNDRELGWVRENTFATSEPVVAFLSSATHPITHTNSTLQEAKDKLVAALVAERLDNT